MSADRAERIAAVLPSCPLCSAEGTFAAVGPKVDPKVRCSTCKAVWSSPEFRTDAEVRDLTLRKKGKGKLAKPASIIQRPKTVEFWRLLHLDPRPRVVEDDVKSLLKSLGPPIKEGPTEGAGAKIRNALEGLDPIRRAELEGIAEDIHRGPQMSALLCLALDGDDRWVRIIGAGLHDPEEKERTDAVMAATYFCGWTGNQLLIPEVIAILASDTAPGVRFAAAATLHQAGPTPEVTAALTAALHDNEIGWSEGPIMAGSLTGFLVAAAGSKPDRTVASAALHSLNLLSENPSPT